MPKRKKCYKSKKNIICESVNSINNSTDEPIIVQLPIQIDNSKIDSEIENSIFIKNEEDINIDNNHKNDFLMKKEIKKKDKIIFKLRKKISDLKNKLDIIHGKTVNKVEVSTSNYNNNTKCWWCKSLFDTVSVGLPDEYYGEKFYCIGHFCSYNCALSYNIDLNDQKLWKRTSLLNILYKNTYNKYIKIMPAPDWRSLKDFGGKLSIDEFRDKFIINTTDYTVLHPPLISRVAQIEKSYRKINNTTVSVLEVEKYLSSKNDEYVLKRDKPLKSSRYSLESTMGLKRKKYKN